ncbi:MAG: hypothetical protein M3R13_10460 [Armatimonadota bacterium]|nr:hypothetical protein [Armatimonadota bacterium]
MKKLQRGNSMMGLMAAVLIICIAAGVYFTGGFGSFGETALPDRPDGQGRTTIGRAANRAKDTVCQSNLRQVNMSVDVAKTAGEAPTSLTELSGLGPEFLRCTIEPREAYVYDGAGGRVTCPHPGHEKY